MALSIRCEHPPCGKTFPLAEQTAQSEVACPHCGGAVNIAALMTVAPSEAFASLPGDADDASWTASRIGRFTVRERLGEGAFGVVWRAHDPQLDREVALKVAKPGSLQTAQGVERFYREARASARLRHPNIVPLYDAGQTEGQHYIATAYIAGQSLHDRMAVGRLPHRETVLIVRRLAEALAYAHSQGIVHRDVKPANVMLDDRGKPILLDFGLAALQTEAERLTHEGAILGTPSYMAPEQAAGQKGEALPASDQYSLGVMLYELLSGQVPFGGSVELVLIAHQKEPPPAPRSFDRGIPRDLETICLKCLEKRPEGRYASCQQLADDLRRWLDGEPIKARRLALPERVTRWCRRKPTLAVLLGVALLNLAAVAALSVLSTRMQAQLRGQLANQVQSTRRAWAEAERLRKEIKARPKPKSELPRDLLASPGKGGKK